MRAADVEGRGRQREIARFEIDVAEHLRAAARQRDGAARQKRCAIRDGDAAGRGAGRRAEEIEPAVADREDGAAAEIILGRGDIEHVAQRGIQQVGGPLPRVDSRAALDGDCVLGQQEHLPGSNDRAGAQHRAV